MVVCSCGGKNGWSLDPKTGYWVCPDCKGPSPLVGNNECASCEKVFVPSRYVEPEMEVICDECKL